MPKIYIEKNVFNDYFFPNFKYLNLLHYGTFKRSGLAKKVANGTKWTLRWQNT